MKKILFLIMILLISMNLSAQDIYIIEDSLQAMFTDSIKKSLRTNVFLATDYSNIDAAVAAFGSREGTLVIDPGTYNISGSSLTIPDNAHLVVRKGAIINAATSKNLYINGTFEAGIYQVFGSNVAVYFDTAAVAVAYPEWWGAASNDTVTDVQAINRSINSVPAGGIILFSPGTYSIGFNDTLHIKSNIVIRGSGVGATKFNYTKTTGDSSLGKYAFKVAGDSNIVFEDFELDGNATYALGGAYCEYDAGIHLDSSAQRIYISNLYIHNTAGDGIEVRWANDVVISNCVITTPNIRRTNPQVGRNGISVLRGNRITITDNILRNGFPACVDIEPTTSETAANIVISDNNLSLGFYALSLNGNASGATLDTVLVNNNVMFDTDSSGVVNWSTTNYIFYNNIISNADGHGLEGRPTQTKYKLLNNEIHNCAKHGILIGQTSSDIEISGNRCYENGWEGIRIAGDTGANRNLFFKITNNTCWNNDSAGTDSYAGIYINYTDSSIFSNNFAYDNQSSPTQVYGFKIESSTDIRISNNTGFNNKSGLMFITGLSNNVIDGEILTAGKILFGTATEPSDALVFLYDSDFASIALQSGGDSRWWIATDTTSSNNTLQIGAAGNTTPSASDYAITINANGGTAFRDSVQVSSGAWIRNTFWSVTGDSMGIISYNTVSSKLDTAWAVTK